MPTYDLDLGGHTYTLNEKRNYWIDPATETAYAWPVNCDYAGDEGSEKKRKIQETANTGNVGLVRQQSGDEGMVLKRSGSILTVPFEVEMWKWFNLCQSQTIYFVEFNGDAYEVQIIMYNPERVGVSGRAKNGKNYYVKYKIEMTVFGFLAGVAADAGLTP